MPIINFISLVAAIVAGASALAVFFRARRSLASRLFAVGMLLLAAEAAINFISYRQLLLVDLLYWQKLRFVPVSLLPSVWLAFSLVYSRGNYGEYLRRWRIAIIAMTVAPRSRTISSRSGFWNPTVDNTREDPPRSASRRIAEARTSGACAPAESSASISASSAISSDKERSAGIQKNMQLRKR